MQILYNIDIFPARFVNNLGDNKVYIKCLFGYETNIIENRIFDDIMIAGIENPKYLLVGIMTGAGFMQINVCDGNKFEKYFKSKWKNLFI